ncbi:hypothetical protein PCE1_002013 [Barthelona sp. PCE]
MWGVEAHTDEECEFSEDYVEILEPDLLICAPEPPLMDVPAESLHAYYPDADDMLEDFHELVHDYIPHVRDFEDIPYFGSGNVSNITAEDINEAEESFVQSKQKQNGYYFVIFFIFYLVFLLFDL